MQYSYFKDNFIYRDKQQRKLYFFSLWLFSYPNTVIKHSTFSVLIENVTLIIC